MSKLIVSSRYGTTPNEILNHKEISLKAKGLYGFLQCKPDSWNFSTERIALQIKESEKVIRATLQELEKFGLLTRRLKPKDDKGKWTGYDYTLHENIKPVIQNPSLPKAVGRETDRIQNGKDISNKEYSKQDIVNKIDIAEASSAIEVIPDLLKDKKTHIQIIGVYALAKRVDFKSTKQQQSFIKRNLRSAQNLSGYDLERIKEVMRHLYKYADFKWTLETVGKYIDEDLSKLVINNHKIAII